MLIRNELTIDADPARVWDLTLDVERWPSITPTMTSVQRLDDGPIRVGSTARVVQPRQRPTIWTVTALDPLSTFAWRTKVGPITMVGTHRLAAHGSGCRQVLSVELTGPGSAPVGRLLRSTIGRAIATENAGFKAAAEAARPTD